MWTSRTFIQLVQLLFILFHQALSAPPGFPSSGNGLWYTSVGAGGVNWAKQWLPIGNGYLAALLHGGTATDTTALNIENLWSGGPFQSSAYNGGNKLATQQAALVKSMQTIRQSVFSNSTGQTSSVSALMTGTTDYGSYAGAGYLVASLNTTGTVSNYFRWLDLDQGLARNSWTQNGVGFNRTSFCSNPTKACVQHIVANTGTLPTISYAFSSDMEGLPAPNITCLSSSSMLVNGFVGAPSMAYALIFNAFASSAEAKITCRQMIVPSWSPPNATLEVISTSTSPNTESWVTWVGDTEYDWDAGDAAHNFTFAGEDPVTKLGALPPISSDYQTLLEQHTADIASTLSTPFTLDLGQTPNLNATTDVLKAQYTIDGPASNAYLEWLLFNYGRYLLASASRGKLPANLQGKWSPGATVSWGADYHSNINIQMNYWIAEMTGLSSAAVPLFDYIEKTWAPRGSYTAQVLYNISQGFVTHDEMNIFGHTGMKSGSAQWANYPESSVWMMIHVWDHFDYTNNITWWQTQGYPLVKGVAQFHLQKLMPDLHSNDGTLVVNPCNSPEQAPITFGCAHAQQLIWQLFNAVEKGFAASGDTDTAFLTDIIGARTQMDKGLKIGSWGQLQEWKVDMDSPTDTHRHLSHLIGLYPGYAITNFNPTVQGTGPAAGYTKDQIVNAAGISLLHRGNGTGADANAGWEKAWRAAAWAQLGNSSMFYHELSFALFENFAPNLFSQYAPTGTPIFQIDANFGFPAAVMNALIQAPDVDSIATPLVVTLIPALPANWPSGSIKGARIRGGTTVDIAWNNGSLTSAMFTVDNNTDVRPRLVNIVYKGVVIHSFTTIPGYQNGVFSSNGGLFSGDT